MGDYLLVLTTFPDQGQAEALAARLVRERLAACVNILPRMVSFYEWEGRLERGEEHLIVAKTRGARYPALEAALREAHPYELPEIIAAPITQGLTEYLGWIDMQTDEGNETR